MASVYLVVAEGPSGFNKLQVLKIMRSDLPQDEHGDFLRMFEDEARLAARLNHPNIVQSHEVGLESGQAYLAMEYLDGQPLGRILHRDRQSQHKALPLPKLLFVLCEVLEGLEYAHTLGDYDGTPLGIVHRDVSPENVFVTYSGQVKIVDFGIAKSLESQKTRVGVLKGKVAYMAPEQILGTAVDHRADLFSVGVMLWQAIAGRPMHHDLSSFEICERVVRGGLPSIRDALPDVPAELAQIVERSLALKRDDRYPDAATFRDELAAFLGPEVSVRPRELGDGIARVFSVERKEISGIIRRGMAGLSPESLLEHGPSTRLITPPPGETPRSTPRMSTLRDASLDMSESTPQRALTTPVMPAQGPWRAWLSYGLIAACVLVAALLALRSREPTEAAANPTVSVSVQAWPDDAEILFDERRLPNPYRAELMRDEARHVLLVQAPGYKPQARVVRLDRDLSASVELVPLARKEPPVPTAASAPPLEPPPSTLPSSPALREPTAATTGAPRGRERVRPERPAAFRDLPAPRPDRSRVPQLDKDDPWAP